MDGITFTSRIEADEYRKRMLAEGKTSKIFTEPSGEWKVMITGETIPRTTGDPLLTPRSKPAPPPTLADKIEEWAIEAEEEKIKEEIKSSVPSSREIRHKKADERKEELEAEQKNRENRGLSKGIIKAIRDSKTHEIIDYELVVPAFKQRLGQKLEKGLRTELQTGAKQEAALKSIPGGLEQTMDNTGNVRGAMKQSIPGKYPGSKANIAWLPEKTEDYIGARRPKIGYMDMPNMGKTGHPYTSVSEEDFLKKNPLKQKPKPIRDERR